MNVRRRAWYRYSLVALAVALLSGVLALLDPVIPLGRYPMVYILLVMLSAYFLGEGPAILALVLGWTAFTYLFLPPPRSWALAGTSDDWAAQASYILGTFIIGFAAAFVRRSRERIQQLVSDLREEIGDRKRAEKALRETEYDLNRAQAVAKTGSWRLDVRCNELRWSDEAYRIFGVEPGTELTYETFLSHVHPEDREYVDRKWQAALTGAPYDVEHRVCADGTMKWVLETAELERDEGGELLGGFGTVRDITDQKRAEEALERALEEARRDRRFIAAVEAVSEAALSAGSLQEVLQLIAIRIREGMGTHSSTIFLLDEDRQELEAVAGCNLPEEIGFRVPANECFVGRILREKRTVYIRDAENDPEITNPHIKRSRAKSLLGTSLIGRRGIVGVVYVDELTVHEFSDDDRRLLGTLAARTALIVEAALLIEELTGNFSMLQRALLPPEPEEIPGYRLASIYRPGARGAEIGGDFYDVFHTEDGCVGIMIGDVVGKGIPSASLAATTRSTLRAFMYDSSSPSESLTHTNAVIGSEKEDPTLFVTVHATVLNPGTGRVCYSGAGHPPPAILRRDTREIEFLHAGDPPTGVVQGFRYSEKEAWLEKGDRIIFYTDGLNEARHDGDLFGMDGIACNLRETADGSPDDVLATLLSNALQWAGGDLQDDTAIIVIEREAQG